MRVSERELAALVLERHAMPIDERPFVDEMAERIKMHTKRVHYILAKWDRKGWWTYGVSLRSGWLTDEGVRALEEKCLTNPR